VAVSIWADACTQSIGLVIYNRAGLHFTAAMRRRCLLAVRSKLGTVKKSDSVIC